ncbi:pentatricopeptide repeat-containing protein At5g04810, chloroplastic-like isoform X2 [Beta vulgaris subsp. vulgaris]|uniref:pentatricopeptide repeat-containing protein At5g04810, chloroplastic-like isoform X2 n=1 Tax=Beta vulgaris subsp. vulgaris TaxID=3555 RepID=UPI002549892F|nr:pentatricopeptide repeat-containing protein At5g04810, chloroplastic-like isoform X2 [Beta vulgaris subsp. vulgaris]
MELSALSSSTAHYIYNYSSSPTFTFSLLAGESHPRFSLSSHNNPEHPSTSSSSSSSSPHFPGNIRRPKTLKTTTTSKPSFTPPKTPSNPLISQNTPSNLTPKLRLTSKISPPPPPPPPNDVVLGDSADTDEEEEEEEEDGEERDSGLVEFRQLGKIFVGNLPLWIKKPEVTEFFQQFGPIENVILIKGHEDIERNMGFGFVIFGGPAAEKSALKAVEFDGVEFHGRVLTVKLDDGRRLKMLARERERWVQGGEGREHRSKWHEERDGSRKEFRKVVDSQPENWQAVVRAFERIKKPSRKEFGQMVTFYARRGDMHRARETFESMRARGIEPNSHVFTSLIHAYAVGRDMEEALSCVRKMKEEGIELSLVTYSILVGGFARIGNVDAGNATN